MSDTSHAPNPSSPARFPNLVRLFELARAAAHPPPGAGRIALALSAGILTHFVFALAVLAMVVAMGFGMSQSLGRVPWPWAAAANALLVLQFPVMHSLLLTGRGTALLARLVPGPHGATLRTTTYALIASVQLLILFAFWTPTGIVWWQAEGAALVGVLTLYALCWLLLMKASFDAGAEVQSGALGWMSLMANRTPRFPDMPQTGLFAVIRHPIYLAFALTTWTVPVWTPDQLALALWLTGYCVLAPMLKERRLHARHGARYARYVAQTPYMLPKPRKDRP